MTRAMHRSIAKTLVFESNTGMATTWRRVLLTAGATGLLALAASAQNVPQPAPAGPPKTQAKPAPTDDNPFPEAESEAAAKDAPAAPAGEPAPTPESSSRSRMKGVDVLGDRDTRASNGAGGVVHDPKLAKEDVRIGQLYLGDGNYAGAYSRFKEATEVGPGNAEAVFYLAQASRKTAHLDEAAANYKLYLDAEPKGKHSKEAKKALTELAGK